MTQKTVLQVEGLMLMNSLVRIIEKLPGPIQPVLEKYCHPVIFDRSRQTCLDRGIMGDFILAVDEKKTLVCPVSTQDRN